MLTPEEPWNIEEVARLMNDEIAHGHSIAIASEGVGHAADIARHIEHHLGARIRPTTFGHGQRGTSPSALDRQLGLRAGREAVYHAEAGIRSSLLAIASESDITPFGIDHVGPMFDSAERTTETQDGGTSEHVSRLSDQEEA